MQNYKETTVNGLSYQRARLVQITNEHEKVPTVTFVEEEITLVGDKKIHADVAQITANFETDGVINWLNPETDEPMNISTTHQELRIILYSLYKQKAFERDNLEAQ